MKLSYLFEDSLADKIKTAMGLRFFKKMQDPERPEKLGTAGNKMLPARSGNQDTPLTPRLRRFFNAPNGATQGKVGFGEPGVTNTRPKPIDDNGELDYPIDKTEQDKEIEKAVRRAYGKNAVAGQKPRPR